MHSSGLHCWSLFVMLVTISRTRPSKWVLRYPSSRIDGRFIYRPYTYLQTWLGVKCPPNFAIYTWYSSKEDVMFTIKNAITSLGVCRWRSTASTPPGREGEGVGMGMETRWLRYARIVCWGRYRSVWSFLAAMACGADGRWKWWLHSSMKPCTKIRNDWT